MSQNKKNLTAILGAFAFVAVLLAVLSGQVHFGTAVTDAWQRGYETGLTVERPLPTIREQMMSIQRQLDLKKIDGKIGPETKPAVNKRVDEEEIDLCNQYSVECIEEALAEAEDN